MPRVRSAKEVPLSTRLETSNLSDQTDRLVSLGVPGLAALDDEEFRALATGLAAHVSPTSVLAVHPSLVPASRLTTLLERNGTAGFVVEDMTDVDGFVPIDSVTLPDRPLYLVDELTRGDDMQGWSPEEALPALLEHGRTPLTVSEGISWLLQRPEVLEPNRCFMTIGSRRPRPRGGLDARTPAIWISGGTGRDGRERRGAPKVGWCWARNRHSWLGFASAARRAPLG